MRDNLVCGLRKEFSPIVFKPITEVELYELLKDLFVVVPFQFIKNDSNFILNFDPPIFKESFETSLDLAIVIFREQFHDFSLDLLIGVELSELRDDLLHHAAVPQLEHADGPALQVLFDSVLDSLEEAKRSVSVVTEFLGNRILDLKVDQLVRELSEDYTVRFEFVHEIYFVNVV
eukprot:CAMPEP_0168321638 /NCGR_PEP_ID=MMETSP0213-20121227/2401_1 /TAXON_ID=151035 /ORGANISM="Euplotes harpa, Strain FSP1.4" /LENGTH=174 /DNA_ID=CAMNT_0008323349 /DNA_START=423 /DNA_END=947 /DNA_ORIENTATION=+